MTLHNNIGANCVCGVAVNQIRCRRHHDDVQTLLRRRLLCKVLDPVRNIYLDSETNKPLEPVASVHEGLLQNLTDEFITLPPDQVCQRGNGMPVWWGVSSDGETAVYDEATLLCTARQIFAHEFGELLDPNIVIPPSSSSPPSTPRPTTPPASGVAVA
eukprot:4893670-Heterocapsa_arctica.AAC.1